MPTLAELRSEPWWDREIVTPELDYLGDELCRRTGRPRVAFGSKGNEKHLKGAHRSQEWILKSRFATSRTSTVQSGLTADQARHVAGADFTPGEWGTAANRALMVQQTKRLRDAMVRGQLPGVTQVIGTLDGRTVTGTRADGSTFSSDSSHLDHWHLTGDRRRMRDRDLMDKIIGTALGEDPDLNTDQAGQLRDVHFTTAAGIPNPLPGGGRVPLHVWAAWMTGAVKALTGTVTALASAAGQSDAIEDMHAELDNLAESVSRFAAEEEARDVATAGALADLQRLLAELDAGTLTQDELVSRIRVQVEAIQPSEADTDVQ
jgi:hypothetical protein